MTFPKKIPIMLCVILLTGMFVLQVSTAIQESQTIDEAVHLSAGLSYWQTGDFRLNPEHPPLIKMLAAIPLLFTQVTAPTNSILWQTWDQYPFGDLFLYHNALPPQTILFLGRLPIMLLSVLLGIWIFRMSREMFGDWGGVLSVGLYALEPGFIAHGHYVTTDLGFTAFAFLTLVRLTKLLDSPTRKNWVWFGVAMFVTGLSKYSAMAWLGAIIITLILLKFREPLHPALQFKKVFKKFLIVLPFIIIVTWAIYGFDIRRRADDPRVALLYSQRADYLATRPAPTSVLEKFAFDLGDRNSRLGKIVDRTASIPIPGYAFFRGFFTVIGHSIGGQGSYLLGQFGDKGWWYYFPIAYFSKTSTPTLIAFFAVVGIGIATIFHQYQQKKSWRRMFLDADRRWLVFTLIPTIFFLTSMTSHLNLGWRHIMPIYPYIFVLAGSLTARQIFPHYNAIIIALVGIVSMIIVQVKTFPNEIGYFNSFAGGSKNGSNILMDSNLDWGQDLLKLTSFMKKNNLNSIPFIGYGYYDINAYLKADYVPNNADIANGLIPHGFIAIGVGLLISSDTSHNWLLTYEPYERLGSGIYVYLFP